jgi:hypothetical protein
MRAAPERIGTEVGAVRVMVVEYVKYRVPLDLRPAFLQGLAHVLKQLDTVGNCLGYELTESTDGPELMVLRVEWSKGSSVHRFRPSAFLPGLVVDGQAFPQFITEKYTCKLTGISKHR